MNASSYNEAFDETGARRAPYRAFQERTGRDPFRPRAESVAGLTRRPLGDRFTILPIPLVLDDREYREIISRGVRQRALALQAFFHDVVLGKPGVLRDTQAPADLLPRILEQEGTNLQELRRWWRGKSREEMRFFYAPDLVRGPEGRWWVLEDNLGCLGGVADSHFVLEAFLRHTGATLDPSIPMSGDLARAVCEFLARIGKTPAAEDVLALVGDEGPNADSEAGRKRRVLEALGVRVLNREELQEATCRGLQSQDVGAVVNFDTRGWVPSSVLTDEMFRDRGIPLMMAPGLEALGNKALLPFLDEIVSFYTGDEPILRTAKTELCPAIPVDPTGWVLKRSNGCQGKEVFFLDEMSAVERSELEASLSKWEPAGAIRQRRVSSSFLPIAPSMAWFRFQVELRPVVFVLGDSVALVSEHASGRASSNLDSRGVGNMSQGAYYLTVIREPTSRWPDGSD